MKVPELVIGFRLAKTEPAAAQIKRLEDLLAGHPVVMYDGWEAIDTHEKSRGEPHGRPRIKLVSWDELLAAAGG